MAESVVAQLPQRFYCHKCSTEIESVSAEYTCPLCAGGFIEELPPNRTERTQSTSSDDVENVREMDHRLIDDRISSLLMSSFSNNMRNFDEAGEIGEANIDVGTSSVGRGRRPRRRTTEAPNIENIMQEFLLSITGGQNATPNQMFFMGNPGDYAWGREGLDSVITQMLNQMENSGPPPLAKDKIKEIPIIEITNEHVEQNLQCSVCWENYECMEQARKLPCDHLFHDNCIIPWLELHGTCPVCRKAVEEDTENPISNRLGNVYRTTFNFFQDNDASMNQSDSDPNLLSFLTQHLSQQTRSDQTRSDPTSTQAGSTSTQAGSTSSTSQRNTSDSRRNNDESRRNNDDSDNTRRRNGRRDRDGNVEFDCD